MRLHRGGLSGPRRLRPPGGRRRVLRPCGADDRRGLHLSGVRRERDPGRFGRPLRPAGKRLPRERLPGANLRGRRRRQGGLRAGGRQVPARISPRGERLHAPAAVSRRYAGRWPRVPARGLRRSAGRADRGHGRLGRTRPRGRRRARHGRALPSPRSAPGCVRLPQAGGIRSPPSHHAYRPRRGSFAGPGSRRRARRRAEEPAGRRRHGTEWLQRGRRRGRPTSSECSGGSGRGGRHPPRGAPRPRRGSQRDRGEGGSALRRARALGRRGQPRDGEKRQGTRKGGGVAKAVFEKASKNASVYTLRLRSPAPPALGWRPDLECEATTWIVISRTRWRP